MYFHEILQNAVYFKVGTLQNIRCSKFVIIFHETFGSDVFYRHFFEEKTFSFLVKHC